MISWSINGNLGQVWVSMNGAPDILFAEGISGSQVANWIQTGASYAFKLYAGTTHSQLVNSVTVTRSA